MNLATHWNGEEFGRANGSEMSVGFHVLVARAAATRPLCAGTIIGSGTVSNAEYGQVGFSCVNERRGIEIVDHSRALTPFVSFDDSIHTEAGNTEGNVLFGSAQQRVVQAQLHQARDRD